jgi:predicted ATPase/class 3 adenylate cyclase
MEIVKCPNCNFENPVGMKFCGNCGKPLVEQEKRGERKIISILYVDIAGFTTISETMDPEKVQEMLNTIFENISYSINKYGGTVHKYIGDEVMALFGAPIAYENHAERAAQAALEINRSIKDVTEMIDLSIELHIALHSGEVVLGRIGDEDVHDYTVIGDTVNVAARLEKIAPAGKILVSRDFYERTKHAFEFSLFGEVEIRGKSVPVACYTLLAARKIRGRMRGIEERKTPFLGRAEEMQFLSNALTEVQENKLLKIAILKGQPGIGKSRLFNEFADGVDKDTALIFETRSLPFGQEELHPFKQLVRNITSVTPEMEEQEAILCIEESFNTIFGDKDIGVVDLIDIMLDFTAVKELQLEPKRKQQIMYCMLENLFKQLSQTKALVIAFEDFHWADPSSLLLLRHLIDFLQDTPILILLITRPLLKDDPIADFLSIYTDQSFSSVLELQPLDKDTSFQLIATLLTIDKIPANVKERIVKRSEGNPLFLEELLKVLMEQKLIYKEGENWKAQKNIEVLDIPQTIHEIVMGRVDLLQSMEKQILQYASVIGRIFWDRPIRDAFKQTMVDELSALSSKGFVQQKVESIFEDAKEYIFSHILIQESIYSSILKRVRKKIHAEFALWLEQSYPEMKPIISNLLAFHFEKGEMWEKAGYYYLESGEEAARNYSNEEAITHYNQAIAIFNKHNPETKHLYNLFKLLGKVEMRMGSNEQSEKHLEQALSLASSGIEKASVEQSLSNLYQKMSRYDTAMEKLLLAKSHISKKACKESIDLLFDQVWLYYMMGKIKEAFETLDRFTDSFAAIRDQLEEKEREELIAESYDKRAILLDYSGDPQGALEFYTKALEIYEKQHSYSGMAAVYNNLAGIYHNLGECSRAIEMYEKSQELDRKMGNKLGTAIGYNNLAEMYIFLNDFEKAEDFLNRYLDINKRIHNKIGFGYAFLNFGRISEQKGEYESALECYLKARAVFEEVKSERLIIVACESLAWLSYHTAAYTESHDYLQIILDHLEKEDNPELQASVRRLQGNLYTREGNFKKAEKALKDSYALYKDLVNTTELISLTGDFVDLYRAAGNGKKIAEFKEKGKNLVDEILRGTDQPELQKSFCGKEEVKKLLD